MPPTETMPPRFSHLRRFLVIGSVVALLLTSCASDDADVEAGADVAATVIADVDAAIGVQEANPDTDNVPEGCRVEQTEDEYGFPVDVVVCDGEPDPDVDPGTVVTFPEWAGGDEADALAELIRDALVLDGGCVAGDRLRDLEVAASGAPADVRDSLESVASELAQASTFCGIDSAQWEAHLRVAIASLEEFVRAADKLREAAPQEVSDG